MTSTEAITPARVSARHLPALDGIRGIAVLLVLAHNMNALSDTSTLARRLYDVAAGWGWLGVQLFFVLSGFLITGILLDTRRSPNYYRAFLARRALRIFPLYYAVLVVAFVVLPATGSTIPGSEHQLWLWLYVENWLAPFGREVTGFTPFWSLSIEEQFYLVWPFVVLALTPQRLKQVGAALVVVALVSRVVLLFGTSLGPKAPYMFTVCRIDALAFGAIAAALYRQPGFIERVQASRRRLRATMVIVTAATLLFTKGAPRIGVLTQTYGYTLFGLLAAALVVDAAIEPDPGDRLLAVLSWPPLRSVGKYSYAIYVFHMPLHLGLGQGLLHGLVGKGQIGVGIALAYLMVGGLATYLAAVASYHLLEKHFLGLKRYFVAH